MALRLVLSNLFLALLSTPMPVVSQLTSIASLAQEDPLASCTIGNLSSIVLNDGSPAGRNLSYAGIDMYVTGKPSSTAVLFLTDIYGLALPQNLLLADSFARAGFLTIAPDLFTHDPAPLDMVSGGGNEFNVTVFLKKHPPERTDPIVMAAVEYARGMEGVKRVAAAGYSFGGRYVLRSLGYDERRADVGFAAYPSGYNDTELRGVRGPVSVAAAEIDGSMSPEERASLEARLRESKMLYQVILYGGTSHGFGVRPNMSDIRSQWSKEAAFGQAVSWFNAWDGS